MYFPFLGRLSITDYIIVVLVYIESIISSVLKLIPQPMIGLFEWLINFSTCSDDNTIEEKLRAAPTIHEMCAIFDISVEDHLVRTEDNYILTLHRIPPISKNRLNNKVVYLHHGLLMCSDVWCCNIERHKNLPFVLHDLGYDVWMGNNRGNKYSTAHLNKPPKSRKFWDFSIDEFAFFDIPNSIEFVLDITKVDKVICIGFSQGSAQMFAAFSLSEKLNQKVSHFIAIAPAMTPKGLHNRIVDTLAKSSPGFMYLFFGRKIVLPSAVIWQRTLHPTLFNLCIDVANKILFNWKSFNILPRQKIASYAKLYSTTSVKSIVHWFQILRSQKFQMFEESDNMLNSLTRPYQIANFPTRTNIKIPILLIYGGIDSLVDIEVMKKNLPFNSVFDVKVDNYEHLDLIWGKDTDTLVIAKVLRFIEFFNPGNVSLKTNQLLPSANLVEELPSATWKTSHQTHGFSYKTHSVDRSPLSVQADEVDENPTTDDTRLLRRVFSTSVIDEDNENEHQDGTEDEIHKEQQRRLSAYLESSNDLRQLDANSSTTALDALSKE